jgi:hypothetical protein
VGGLLAGCSATQHREQVEQRTYQIIDETRETAFGRSEPFTIQSPADALRRRLLLSQSLPYAGPASLGADHLPLIPHWPEERVVAVINDPAAPDTTALVLSLNDALQIAAKNSREFQSQKEDVFRTALELDLERDQFRTSFAGLVSGAFQHDRAGLDEVGGVVAESAGGAVSAPHEQQLQNRASV